VFLNPGVVGKAAGRWHARLLPEWSHLAMIGFISAIFGAIAYEATGVNGVWGTTVGAIPETLEKKLAWYSVVILFVCKFIAMILATAAGGPGGTLVPSLAAGGLVGIIVARVFSQSEASVAACAVIGMGSLFASVMHLPVTGVIIMFELTWAKSLIVHVIFANFIASNVVLRLPLGRHSFVHRTLEHDPVWLKLGGRDFIETDEQEKHALNNVGVGQIHSMRTSVLKWWIMTDNEMLKSVFMAWKVETRATGHRGRQELALLGAQHEKHLCRLLEMGDERLKQLGWGAFVSNYIACLKLARKRAVELLASG